MVVVVVVVLLAGMVAATVASAVVEESSPQRPLQPLSPSLRTIVCCGLCQSPIIASAIPWPFRTRAAVVQLRVE